MRDSARQVHRFASLSAGAENQIDDHIGRERLNCFSTRWEMIAIALNVTQIGGGVTVPPVQDGNFVPAREQFSRQGRSDETVSANQKDSRVALLIRTRVLSPARIPEKRRKNRKDRRAQKESRALCRRPGSSLS